jgi:osmotically-inducible protein OsmY
MRRSFLLFFLPLFLCIGGLIAPVQAGTTSKAANVGRVATPTDAQIDAIIRAKLAKSKIGKDGFRFKVARGVVTWEGNTGVVQHKGAATRMAKTAGAVQVVNNIQISADAKAKAAAHLKKASVTE